MATSINCKTLNATYKGKLVCDGKVELYQGVKYANIPGRWQTPEPIDRYSEGTVVDCTEEGFQCPQRGQTGDEFWFAIPESQRIPQRFQENEFECLSMKIARPTGTGTDQLLPVALYVHGGANISGTAYNSVLDPCHLVEFSASKGKPIIFINTQYRLGKIGFRGFNGKGNWALKDLETSAHWVKNHIRDFGGDPNNITMFGESAGSIDLHALCLHDPDFNKVINKMGFISGSLTNIDLSTIEKEEKKNELDRERLGIDDLTQAKVDDLIRDTRELHTPVRDDGYFSQSFDNTTAFGFEAVFLISCGNEDVVFGPVENHVGSEKIKKLDETETGRSLKSLYGISGSSLSDWKAVRRARADFMFSAPMLNMYDKMTTQTKAFYMFYDHDNPYDKRFGAHHSLPLLMLFRNYEMGDEYVKYSDDLRSRLIDFFYNEEPWESKNGLNYTNDGIKMVPMDRLEEIRNTKAYRFLNQGDREEINQVLTSVMPDAV